MTNATVAKRLRQYARTPLGDARPHAGGHWLKTLQGYELRTTVSWAFSGDPNEAEAQLLAAFANAGRSGQPSSPSLPFANLMLPSGYRKTHGITASRRR
jgi:hypothetical protein